MATGTNSDAPADQAKAGWAELFRDGRAVPTLLLNLGISLHALDIFIIITVMPSVVDDIGGLAWYTWASSLYMVGSIVGAASGGYVHARIGRRRGYVFGGLVLLVGSIGCAVPPDMATLLVARVIKGLGGGLVLSQSMILVRELYDHNLRPRMLAVITGIWSVASIIGPALGGVFGEIGWWRGAFWATVPFAIGFCWMAMKVIPEVTPEGAGRLAWRRLLMLAAGVVCVSLTSEYKQTLPATLLVAAAVALTFLTFRRDAASEQRLFPSHPLSFTHRVGLAYWVYFLISMTHSSLLIFAPLFLGVLHGVSPLFVGYLSLIFSFAWTGGSVLTSGLTGKAERVASIGGLVLCTVSIIGFAAGVVGVLPAPLVTVSIAITLAGLGIGATNVHMTAFGMSAALKGEESITASSMPTIRSLGIAFGAAVAGLVANTAGLDGGATPETVHRVAIWVLALSALVPMLGALCTLRALTLKD
jgi:predicted MFS family arabinose efflux permease